MKTPVLSYLPDYAQGGALFFNSQGAGYQDGRDYWTQARVQKGGLFALVSYNYKDGGGTKDPTFLYNSGFRQVSRNMSPRSTGSIQL